MAKRHRNNKGLMWNINWYVGENSGKISMTSLQKEMWIKDTLLYLKWLAEIPNIKNGKLIKEIWDDLNLIRLVIEFESDWGPGQCDIVQICGWEPLFFKNNKTIKGGITYKIEKTSENYLASCKTNKKNFNDIIEAKRWLTKINNGWPI